METRHSRARTQVCARTRAHQQTARRIARGWLRGLRGTMKDAIKKGNNEELPDFYNIVLERPREDPAGYDVLFVDAASKVTSAPCKRDSAFLSGYP